MRYLVGAVLLLVAFAFQVKTILLFRKMMKEVNEVLPNDSQIPEIGPSWLRGKVIKQHRNWFPASKLRKQMYTFWGIEMAVFISALACILRFKS